MSQTTTLILLPQTTYLNPGNSAPYTVTGNSNPAAAYYLGNQDLQTVNIKLTNCTGNIVLEASLATTPTSNDWFKVYELEANANAVANSAPQIASNASVYTNVQGNFVFMRAKVEDFQGGTVQFVKLTY
jgi:PHD/YefM family antitoxin component YafN of YafNO toxin-antitoxin module